MPSPVDELLAKRLVVLSGKGGVGKSVVGAALALAAVDRGKRVLLVEVDAPLEAAHFLGGGARGANENEVRPGLTTVNLDPFRVMDEYVRHVVRIEMLVRKILGSPIYRRFFAAAPGLKELMVLGKIMTLEAARDGWSKRPRYDLLIVDAPATGHGLSFLKVPVAALSASPYGPIGANARRILALLRDGRKTGLGIVAVPEEMAVVEAAWFHRQAVEDVGMTPEAVFLNAAHERRFTDDQEAELLRLTAAGADGRLARGVRLAPALEAARRHLRRRRMTRFYQNRLRRSLGLPVVTLPYLYREIGPDEVRVLADRIGSA
jgi:anion-transporting  ArsA/GET3 family ATPase